MHLQSRITAPKTTHIYHFVVQINGKHTIKVQQIAMVGKVTELIDFIFENSKALIGPD